MAQLVKNLSVIRETWVRPLGWEDPLEKGVNAEGEEVFFEADSVVLATGFKPNKALAETFRNTAYDVVPVGDCVKIGNLVGAVRTGFDAGLRL